MTILDKVKIGNTVKVNLELSKDRLTKETIQAINTSSECVVSDFKITDGKGIGVFLLLSNGKEEWFFENEIQILDSKGNIIEKQDIQNENKNIIFVFFNGLNYETKFKLKLINKISFFMQEFLHRDLSSSLLSISVLLGWIGISFVLLRILALTIKKILEALFKNSNQ